MGTLSNGGVSQLSRSSLIPMFDVNSGLSALYAFDPFSGFNDPINPSRYSFKIEDVIPGRTPTVSRIVLSYRDLGIATITLSFTGTQDEKVVDSTILPSFSTTVVIGNQKATNKILTKVISIQATAENLQFTILRPANGGPVSITKVLLCGRVELQVYA